MSNEAGCVLCDPERADRELGRVTVWTDGVWRLAVALESEVLGFAFLEPIRHVPHVTDLDGREAATFGPVLGTVSRILQEEAGADLVYLFVFGGGVPHLHVHLAPHRDGDALNTQMIKGNVVEEHLPNGATRLISDQFPPLPVDQLQDVAERVRLRLAPG